MKTISFSAIALLEEAETYLYYESQSAGLGDRFLKEVENALDRVSQNPTHYTFIDATKTIRDVAIENFHISLSFKFLKIQLSFIIYIIQRKTDNVFTKTKPDTPPISSHPRPGSRNYINT